MIIRISNRSNIIPIIINFIWTLFILYQFIFRVPEFELEKPDGASYLIFGIIIFTGLVFLGSLIYIIIANLYMKMKIYLDLGYVFIPITVLLIFLFLN